MTPQITLASLICAAVTFAHGSELTALRMIESGDNPRARGSKGERTAYQILPSTWKQYADKGMRYDTRHHADEVASRILCAQRTAFFTVARRQPARAEVYAMWNLGFAGFKRRGFDLARCPHVTQDAAMRFAALAEDLYERN